MSATFHGIDASNQSDNPSQQAMRDIEGMHWSNYVGHWLQSPGQQESLEVILPCYNSFPI